MSPLIPPRFPLNFAITLSLGEGEPCRVGMTQNMSLSGIALEFEPIQSEVPKAHFERAVLRGAPIVVKIEIPEAGDKTGHGPKELKLTARLVWHDQRSCGLAILDMTPEERQFYESLIEGYRTLCRSFAALHRAA